MSPTKVSTARSLALPAAVMGVAAIPYLMLLPAQFHVAADAAATARNIMANETLYRAYVLCGLVSGVGFVWYGLGLYHGFGAIDRLQARLLVALVVVATAIGTLNLVNDLAAPWLLSGRDSLASFARPQLESLAMTFIGLRNAGVHVESVYWGLWLFPYGVLVWKSGVVPRWIGVCLFAGGVAYVAMGVTGVVFPSHVRTMARIVMPFYAIGELPIFLWLLMRGGRVTLPVRPPETVAAM